MRDVIFGNCRPSGRYAYLIVVVLAVAGVGHAATLIPSGLRCEARVNPIAVQTTQPRLSWLLEPADSSLRGLKQTAYRILAASSRKQLAENRGDLWDTGKVVSNDTIEIPYRGRPLESGVEYFWKVRVWDQDGEASRGSAAG